MTRSLALPFALEADVVVVDGAALEHAKVVNVLLTEPGELPWRTAFGASLDRLRHQPTDAVQRELLRVRAGDALATWAPGVVTRVEPGALTDTTISLRVTIGDASTSAVEVVR